MYLTLYHPEDNLLVISIVVFLGIVAKILEEVEALFLRLRLALVTPFCVEVEGLLLLPFRVTYLLETYPVLPLYLILYHPEVDLFIISIEVFLGIVAIILDEVEALFLKLTLSVVMPFCVEVEGLSSLLSRVTYLLET